MTSKGTPRRSIRIDPVLWDAASKAAELRGTDVSTVIRDALADYVINGTCTLAVARTIARELR